MPYTTDAARWRALSTRDPAANTHFVYTVKSTNVYCRPTCPARLARRANIGFAATPADAEAAGYRACKRCRPNLETCEDPQFKAVAKARGLIEEAVAKEQQEGGGGGGAGVFRLQDLAKRVGLTPRYFHKIFKDRVGMTPREYALVKKRERSGSEESGESGGGGEQVVGGDGGAPTAYVPHEGGAVVDLGPFSFDQFDFGDYLNVGADSSPPLSDPSGMPTWESLESTSGSLDGEVYMNQSAPCALPTMGFDTFDKGLDFVYDNTIQGDYASSVPEATAMATTAMFDLDAALLFGSNTLPDFNQGVYGQVFA